MVTTRETPCRAALENRRDAQQRVETGIAHKRVEIEMVDAGAERFGVLDGLGPFLSKNWVMKDLVGNLGPSSELGTK